MKVLVTVPAYNEESNIEKLILKLKALEELCDVIIINDCSTDFTSDICKRAGMNVIDLPCNLGIGGVGQTGFKYAMRKGYDVVVNIDGDGQHNPEFIPAMLDPIVRGKADMVIGSRYIERNGFQSTAIRRFGISYFSKLIYILTGQYITDPTSGFRACSKNVINLFSKNFPRDYPLPESIVFLKRSNFKIVEVPVLMNERQGGKSSINPVKSIYYMVKVSLAILIEMSRRRVCMEDNNDYAEA